MEKDRHLTEKNVGERVVREGRGLGLIKGEKSGILERWRRFRELIRDGRSLELILEGKGGYLLERERRGRG